MDFGDFENYLRQIQGQAEHGIEAYIYGLRQVPENLLLEENADKLNDWLETNKKPPNTNYLIVAALRKFLKYRRKPDIALKIESVKLKKRKVLKSITKDEVQKLFSVIDSKRDLLLIRLLYDTACRVSELVNIGKEDIEFKEGSETKIAGNIKIYGKGQKERPVPYNRKTAELLKDYMKDMKNSKLFDIGTRQVRKLLAKYTRKAGLPEWVSPHVLRASWATHRLEDGMGIDYIKAVLGHENIATTDRYLRSSKERIMQIAEEHANEL